MSIATERRRLWRYNIDACTFVRCRLVFSFTGPEDDQHATLEEVEIKTLSINLGGGRWIHFNNTLSKNEISKEKCEQLVATIEQHFEERDDDFWDAAFN